MLPADFCGCAHALVLVVRRQADIDDGEMRLVFGDDGEQRLGVAHPCNDLVPGILEQSREPLAQQDRVLGDHDPHGISASSRVPAPVGLWISSVPPWASTLSVRPVSPVPPASVAPPMPSSATTN